MMRIQDLAKRVTPVDTLVRRPPWLYNRLRAEIAETDDMDLAGRKLRQETGLAEVLRAAGNAPYYKGRGIHGAINAFPLLDKPTVREHGEAMRPSNMRIAARAVTSGSTGIPLVLWRSPSMVFHEQATIDHLISKAGFDPISARVLLLRADTFKHPDDVEPPFWKHFSPNKAALSTQHLNKRTFPLYADFIREFRPDFLFAYAASFDLLLRFLEDTPHKLRIPLVITSCEAPAHDLRSRASAQLGSVMLDYYGQSERVACAWSIEDGKYWFRPEYGAVEFTPSEFGLEAVGTSLHNTAQFLIRYRTGDIVEIDGDADEERMKRIALGLEPFAGISGRLCEFLTLADGTRIVGLNQIIRDICGVASTQIVQKNFDRVEILIVPTSGFDESTVSTLRQRFANKVPSSVSCEIRTIDKPLRTKAGKMPLFINEMESEQ